MRLPAAAILAAALAAVAAVAAASPVELLLRNPFPGGSR
jgi:hypothetical protein